MKSKATDILVIENIVEDALLIHNWLKENNHRDYNYTNAQSLIEASEHISRHEPDIILMDLDLPEFEDPSTINTVLNQYSHIPFIVLTNENAENTGINAIQKGAQDFLIKGNFDGYLLYRAIQYAIERKQTEEKLRKSEEKYKDLFFRSQDAIYISTKSGKFIDINPAGLRMFGYKKEDLKTMSVLDLYLNPKDRLLLVDQLDKDSEISDYEVMLKKKSGKEPLICLLNTLSIRDNKGEIIAYQGIIRNITARKKAEQDLKKSMERLDKANKKLRELNVTLENKVKERTQELIEEKELVDKQNRDITQSINYAKRIQISILPDTNTIKTNLPNSFIFYKPKDIVSGDFYWFQSFKSKVILAIVDCTGHGVPGAFMSIIGHTQLNQIIIENRIYEPGVILQELDKKVRTSLNQFKNNTGANDGMELGILSIDFETYKIDFAGAMRPLYFIKKDKLHVIKGDKHSIGGFSTFAKKFKSHSIKIEKNDTFYLFTDGYPDQFGGPLGKKFKTSNVEKMLSAIYPLSMNEQLKIVEETHNSWREDEEQVDDILMAGIKF